MISPLTFISLLLISGPGAVGGHPAGHGAGQLTDLPVAGIAIFLLLRLHHVSHAANPALDITIKYCQGSFLAKVYL